MTWDFAWGSCGTHGTGTASGEGAWPSTFAFNWEKGCTAGNDGWGKGDVDRNFCFRKGAWNSPNNGCWGKGTAAGNGAWKTGSWPKGGWDKGCWGKVPAPYRGGWDEDSWEKGASTGNGGWDRHREPEKAAVKGKDVGKTAGKIAAKGKYAGREEPAGEPRPSEHGKAFTSEAWLVDGSRIPVEGSPASATEERPRGQSYCFATDATICISGLPSSADEKVVNNYFLMFGQVLDVSIKYHDSGAPSGCGFVTFADPDAAEMVVSFYSAENWHPLDFDDAGTFIQCSRVAPGQPVRVEGRPEAKAWTVAKAPHGKAVSWASTPWKAAPQAAAPWKEAPFKAAPAGAHAKATAHTSADGTQKPASKQVSAAYVEQVLVSPGYDSWAEGHKAKDQLDDAAPWKEANPIEDDKQIWAGGLPRPRSTTKEERSAGCVLVRQRSAGAAQGATEPEALLIRRGQLSVFELPKGHLEGAETASQAAERELREETGLESLVNIGPIVYSDTYTLPRTGVPKTVDYFLCTPSNAGQTSFGGNRETLTKELLWVSLHELAQLRFKSGAQKECARKALQMVNCSAGIGPWVRASSSDPSR